MRLWGAMMIRLYENPGWGSAIVELQLAFYGMPHELVPAGGVTDPVAVQKAMAGVNPVGQVPALILPSGEVMTETAAITLYLADLTGSDALVPGAAAAERAGFLRWLIFLVAAVYPSFAYGDVPERFVPGTRAAKFGHKVIAHRKSMWRVMEAEAVQRGGPYFLGSRMTAIDFYLVCMLRWTPGVAWFQTETPILWRAAEQAAALPVLAAVLKRNFG